jgi:hypothetical protein
MALSRDHSRNPIHQPPGNTLSSALGLVNDYDSAFLDEIDSNNHYLIGQTALSTQAHRYSGLVREKNPVGWAFYSYSNIAKLLAKIRGIQADVKFEDISECMEEVYYETAGQRVVTATPNFPRDPLSVIPAMNAAVIRRYSTDWAARKERMMYYTQYKMNHRGMEPVYTAKHYSKRKQLENDIWA